MANSFLALSTCAALATCVRATEPEFPSEAVLLPTPPPYSYWWTLTESCSQSTGDFGAVRWYVMPGHSRITIAGDDYDGHWFPVSNRIVLAADAVLAGSLVRHEMLHALTGPGHSRDRFEERCGGIVDCIDLCARETGGPLVPDSAAAEIDAASLEVKVAVFPNEPSVTTHDGWITIITSARNPLATPVWAKLVAVEPGSHAASTFGFIVQCTSRCTGGTGSSYDYVEASRFGFGPTAERREAFDFHLGAGTYSVRGTFNADTTSAVRISVLP